MPINPELLIAAPMLQDYLVDKDTGFPLAEGIISLYIDTERTFYKNWYYQTGSPGAYTYIALPNPLYLSSVGTIQDPNGNDVIPFYYPYDENNEDDPQAYYITVYSSDIDGNPAILQFTRENFPFNPNSTSPIVTNAVTNRNYILNNVYWRNVGPQDLTNVTDMVIAPSQHDGYTNGDIRFLKSVNGASDSLTFTAFTTPLNAAQQVTTPEYYINMICDGVQDGETQKCIQYPISLHVDTLSSVSGTVVIQAQNVAGSINNVLSIYIYQFLGTGALTQPAPVLIEAITLDDTFQQYEIPFTFASSEGLSLGTGGDDAFFLQVQYPLSKLFQINHAKPQLFLSSEVPTNDFDTYDQIETIINSPRTGDVRVSLNSFYPYGYVPMSGGTIGDASSNATARANIDSWPLFNLLWQSFNKYTSGTTNLLAQMVTSAGSNVAYGSTAIADWTANNAITLTKSMGQVILGTVPQAAQISSYSVPFTASNSSGLLITASENAVNFFNGMPISFINSGGALPTGLAANVIYYVSEFNGTTEFHVSTTFSNAINSVVIGYTDSGSGTSTFIFAIAGSNEGEYAHSQLIAELASHNHSIINQITATGSTIAGGSGFNSATTTTGSTGSGTPFNVTQPGVFYNMFMKL